MYKVCLELYEGKVHWKCYEMKIYKAGWDTRNILLRTCRSLKLLLNFVLRVQLRDLIGGSRHVGPAYLAADGSAVLSQLQDASRRLEVSEIHQIRGRIHERTNSFDVSGHNLESSQT